MKSLKELLGKGKEGKKERSRERAFKMLTVLSMLSFVVIGVKRGNAYEYGIMEDALGSVLKAEFKAERNGVNSVACNIYRVFGNGNEAMRRALEDFSSRLQRDRKVVLFYDRDKGEFVVCSGKELVERYTGSSVNSYTEARTVYVSRDVSRERNEDVVDKTEKIKRSVYNLDSTIRDLTYTVSRISSLFRK